MSDTTPTLPEADDRNRTGNRLITNQVLCQLSYVSTTQHASVTRRRAEQVIGATSGQVGESIPKTP
jgi:hypothetical protein